MIKDHGGSAFPDFPIYELDEEDGVYSITSDQQSLGMTLRDYFAASFVKSGHIFKSISDGNTPELVAMQAYELADAMIREREL